MLRPEVPTNGRSTSPGEGGARTHAGGTLVPRAMHDVAEFLSAHDPFAALQPDELEDLAGRVQIEYFEAGATIFRQGEGPPDAMWVLRTGAIELRDDGRVLDLLGEGEPFGHPWMLSGLPIGWEARARESSLCYRLAAADVIPRLADPAGLRWVARTLIGRAPAGTAPATPEGGLETGQRDGAQPDPQAPSGLHARRLDARGRRPHGGRRRELDPGPPRRGRARNRHRPRPALPGRREGTLAGDPGWRGDEHPGVHRSPRADHRRADADDDRPGYPPRPGRLGPGRRPRRGDRCRPARRGDADARSCCGGRSPTPPTSRPYARSPTQLNSP